MLSGFVELPWMFFFFSRSLIVADVSAPPLQSSSAPVVYSLYWLKQCTIQYESGTDVYCVLIMSSELRHRNISTSACVCSSEGQTSTELIFFALDKKCPLQGQWRGSLFHFYLWKSTKRFSWNVVFFCVFFFTVAAFLFSCGMCAKHSITALRYVWL